MDIKRIWISKRIYKMRQKGIYLKGFGYLKGYRGICPKQNK